MIRQVFVWLLAVAAATLMGGCEDEAAKQQQEQAQQEPEWKVEVSVGGEQVEEAQVAAKKVKLDTSIGDIVVELDEEKAPKTVANFLRYVEEGFYGGTIFHRVIPDFMIQGGGFTQDMQQKQTHEPIVNEASNGLKNVRGTIAMARTNNPNSATAQFFINVVDNSYLNYSGAQNPGYAVFGKVVEGMDVVDKITAVKTGNKGPHQNVPVTPVVINSATLASGE
jgi:cyclophilin family peptidyl-prolyl cis-trans isomerase